ncbi:MAG: CAP domain-containing protein [Thermoleophilia bacterium]|nr:CAP domain-containing protein [Thermoleophilia bacterium]
MCGITSVAGAAGGGAPAKVAATSVAGASGAPTKVAGESGGGMPDAKGGGPEGAVDGASAIGGGTDLQSALKSLAAAVKKLGEAVQGLMNSLSHGVAGVQGQAATKKQFVAKVASTTKSSGKEDSAFEQRVLELINQERAKYGLSPVVYSGTLDNAAEKHADHMAIVGKMAHDGIGDGDPGERIRAEGFRKSWGENVATGQTTPEQVVREWMASPGHRRNILDPNYRQMGVSYVTSSSGRTYWAQEFGA